MKFECEKSMLASAIEGVSRAITNRAAIPVLEGIYMKAEGFNLTLTGYDMEMGITTTIECNVLVPGETVLDAKLLGSMVSRMPAGNVRIELNDEGQAKISGGVAEFEIPALNASDYPSLPVTGADNTMTMKCGVIREMIEKTIYAVSQDDKKPAHTGELFVIEPGSLTVVALDGYRLAIIQLRRVHPRHPHHHPQQNAAGTAQDHGRRRRGREDRCQPPLCRVHHQRLHHHEPPDRGRLPELRERYPEG